MNSFALFIKVKLKKGIEIMRIKIIEILDSNFYRQGFSGIVEACHNNKLLVSCTTNDNIPYKVYWMVDEYRENDPSAWTYFGESHQYNIERKLARFWPNRKEL